MINWFSDSVVERPYDFNGYVDPMPLFVPSLQVAGCDVLDCQTILDIDNDTKDM